MENNFKQWNLNQKKNEFKERRAEIRRKHENEMWLLDQEYRTNCRRKKLELEEKLAAVNKEQAKFEDEYRQWRHEQFAQQEKEGGEK